VQQLQQLGYEQLVTRTHAELELIAIVWMNFSRVRNRTTCFWRRRAWRHPRQ